MSIKPKKELFPPLFYTGKSDLYWMHKMVKTYGHQKP